MEKAPKGCSSIRILSRTRVKSIDRLQAFGMVVLLLATEMISLALQAYTLLNSCALKSETVAFVVVRSIGMLE